MSEVKTIRINKVLRELNISLDRAVEQLGEHGFEIEARPTSKISKDEYQILVDAFQTDRNKKEASEEVSEEKRKEKEAIRQRIEEEQEAKNQVVQARTELKGLRQVGKIDLEPKAKPKEEVKEAKNTETSKAESTKTVDSVEKPILQNSTDERQVEAQETSIASDAEKVTTQYKKLTGLKIAGDKIDLKKFEKNETNPSADNNDRKRRRK